MDHNRRSLERHAAELREQRSPKCPLPNVETENQGTYAHLRLVGPRDLGTATLEWVHSLSGRVAQCGPYTDRDMHPKADMSRFLILAEIPVSEP